MTMTEALIGLRAALASTRYPLSLPGSQEASHLAAATARQLDDYLIPRLSKLDAPLLVVVGGSTGAGKSTLVNSVAGQTVSAAGARRPTTRAPVLVCHPDDAGWFNEANLLPTISRGEDFRVVPLPEVAPGLALLDAPDIDSVEEANRALAEQLLAAADLWLFITTAVRYADAVPWELLTQARNRGTTVAIVLNRVPPGAEAEVAPHLVEMLASHGLSTTRMFVIEEQALDPEKLLPPNAIAEIKSWLEALAASTAARAAVVRQTVEGALTALGPTTARLAVEADAQADTLKTLAGSVDSAYREAASEVAQGVSDGELFRGEVLARWQELAGTGEFMRGLQRRVGRLRDRIVSAVTGKPMPGEELKSALETGLVTFVHGTAADAAERAVKSWRAHPAGVALARAELGRASPDIVERIDRTVRDWQRGVLDLVRTESSKKLFAAKASAYAVNALGLCLMVVVFTATAFIPTGAEIAVAGGTTIAAQKLLEAIFGDDAVRRLAAQARTDLLSRVDTLLEGEAARFHEALASTGVDPEAGQRLRAAAAYVKASV
ncbi:MAG TPA: GTPase domain-containing protein [Candidatus Limnocylindrales bacterium]